MGQYGYSRTLAQGVCTSVAGDGSLAGGATSVTLSETRYGTLPAAPFYLALEDGTARFEMVKVTVLAGNVATVTRAQKGTAAVAHPFPFTWAFGVTDDELGRLVGTLA